LKLIIIDGRTCSLEEVGGGLTHFIIALATAATRRPLKHFFSARVVKSSYGDDYRALEPLRALKDLGPWWSRSDSRLITANGDRPDLDRTDLGGFIERRTASLAGPDRSAAAAR